MENNSILIRRVTTFSQRDADAIRSLAYQIGKNYQQPSDQEIESMLALPSTHLFFAEDSATKQIVGMITLLVIRIPYVRKAVLEDLIIDESARGMGIGTKLMQYAIDMAKKENAAYIDFTSRPRRAEGNNLYEKLGFEKRDTNVYRIIFNYGEV